MAKKRINRQDLTLKNLHHIKGELQRVKMSLRGEIKLLDKRIKKLERAQTFTIIGR